MTRDAGSGSAHDVAEALFDALLESSPFMASTLGMPGHDHEVPDVSPAGDERLLAELETVERLLNNAPQLGPADRITATCVANTINNERLHIASADSEFTVTPMPFAGPAVLFAVAARTVIADAQAADDYVTRLAASGQFVDQLTDRLKDGAAKGKLPVASLVAQAIEWIDKQLAERVPPAMLAPQPPAGWDGENKWRTDIEQAVTDRLRPALQRWRDTIADELLTQARDDDHAGLAHLPGGEEIYGHAIEVHTTLPLTPQELHQSGLEEIARLEALALQLGADLGLTTIADIHAAMRQASSETDPEAAIAAAVAAIRRAEAVAGEIFPKPLPQPCAVEPMPPAVAASGMAPHYTRPRIDGARPGTYWFNTALPTAGTGWDLEAVAFHEAVPGHHLQLSRAQLLTDLPRLQGNFSVTVHSEGWGLYAEQLAEEIGLYTDNRAKLGAVGASLMRAARLVVDTGLHAFGWSRTRALEYFTAHVPMPKEFLANEIDRYIVVPGQALAYQTGKYEILRLRDYARASLGDSFDLPGFHATVLDSGSISMPSLQAAVDGWIGIRKGS